jgi:hypothetical protein
MLWPIGIPKLRSSFRREPRQFRTRLRRRSAIGILQRSKSMDAWAGSAVLAIIVGAWLKLRSIGTRPSLTGDFKPGLTWGIPCQARSTAIIATPLAADPRLEPISTRGDDNRIYLHSVGRRCCPYHDSSFSRTSGSGRVGSISVPRHVSAPSGHDRHPPGSSGSVRMIDPRIG